jgi:ATP-dependent helicase/nuclease subunit A
MTELQLIASNPSYSVWVEASAGSGKTKVLTDRILRLLLAKTQPSKILALTFTKAAAAEMLHRINKELSDWSLLDDKVLSEKLLKLTSEQPSKEAIYFARSLFSTLLDITEGLKIQTIHSFCQQIMRKFPIEAGISPNFEIIDDIAADQILKEAKIEALLNQDISESINYITLNIHESSFHELFKSIIEKKHKILDLITYHNGLENLIISTYKKLNVTPEADEEKLINDFCHDDNFNCFELREKCKLLLQGSKTDILRGEQILSWLELSIVERVKRFPEYKSCLLTKEEQAYKSCVTKLIAEKYPEIEQLLREEQQRILRFLEKRKSLRIATLTKHFLILANHLIEKYELLKKQYNYLDYSDLIHLTKTLLNDSYVSEWILYKLDGGIDHILIDEAQDTNIDQWQIIQSLCAEFFAGQGRKDINRTLFVVGDEKQAIYSFQGSDPFIFNQMQQFFKQKSEEAFKDFMPVTLDLSFRSCQIILKAVDQIFTEEYIKNAVCNSGKDIAHKHFRAEYHGKVELWPIVVPSKEETIPEIDEWRLPFIRKKKNNSAKILTELIACKIEEWLTTKRFLPSKGREVQPGDIMILVRRRNEFTDLLIKSLKEKNIPIAGIDRIYIKDNIAIQDLIVLGKFILLPEDDLNLAILLKSPIIGMSENELFTLCHARAEKSVWEMLKAAPEFLTIYNYLNSLLKCDFNYKPFSFYSYVLEVANGKEKFITRLGKQVEEFLEEFLNLSLKYEQNNLPSMQGFIDYLESNDIEIKRDPEQSSDQIKIMTVHGSKGLQAPIIFLPDTTQVPRSEESILWDAEDNLLYWPAKTTNHNNLCAILREKRQKQEKAEYYRLLYVALTRAEDELYIAGYQGKGFLPKDCWYNVIHSALNKGNPGIKFNLPKNFEYDTSNFSSEEMLELA